VKLQGKQSQAGPRPGGKTGERKKEGNRLRGGGSRWKKEPPVGGKNGGLKGEKPGEKTWKRAKRTNRSKRPEKRGDVGDIDRVEKSKGQRERQKDTGDLPSGQEGLCRKNPLREFCQQNSKEDCEDLAQIDKVKRERTPQGEKTGKKEKRGRGRVRGFPIESWGKRKKTGMRVRKSDH